MMRLTIAVLFMLSVCSCSSEPNDPTLAPVFVVMCQSLSDSVDPDVPPSIESTPCCTGFALGGEVVTANHCATGDAVVLVSRSQWLNTSNGSEIGTVLRRDTERDIAWLSAAIDGPELERGGPVKTGDSVRALTRGGARPGVVATQSGVFWSTSADTAMGDSGSAIVDDAGRAIGVLSRCLTADGNTCDRGTGIFAELPGGGT